ncbi:unnamed protein product [Tetraodon nigroviridis]|uniref:(spotted green pufferfish) hypothetical protein n=1 Tax=Tetraodon nigroviridis TaxID=99883 RepID=Q4S251_TETNG|nr:unnamed protein product [Tetraodon nigroviridis]
MATEVRQELSQLMNSSGSHKDLAAKYRQILDKAIQFTDVDQLESLKAFVEASTRCPSKFEFLKCSTWF